MIENPTGVIVALCHLRQGSVLLHIGDHVRAGDLCGGCGSSGNSTEPDVHLQAIDTLDVENARAVPISSHGSMPANGEVVDIPHQ